MPGAPAADPEAQWLEAVTRSLRGAAFEKRLVTTTPEGVPVDPVYLPRHAVGLSPRGAPGVTPYVRGARPSAAGPWLLADRYQAALEAERLAADGLMGVEAAWVCGSSRTSAAAWAAMARAAAGRPLFLEAAEGAPAAFGALADAGASAVSPLFDPMGTLLRRGALERGKGKLWGDAAWLVAQLEQRAAGASARTFALGVGGSVVHEAGGHAALELGFALACLVELARSLEGEGVSPARTFAATAMIVTAGVEHLDVVAKMRALRLAYAKCAGALGVAPAPPPFVVGHVSRRAQARPDPATNHVRACLEVFGLAVGGADVIVSRSLGGDAEAVRMGPRTQLVLREESRLGWVADPAGGAYYVEALTEALARAAWEELTRIEGEGGASASLEAGHLQARVRAAAARREHEVRQRSRVIVGVSNFADPAEIARAFEPAGTAAGTAADELEPPRDAEQALVPARDAAPFEAIQRRTAALRRSGRLRPVLLLRLGGPGEADAREDFARRFFEAGGLLTVPGGPPEAPSDLAGILTRSGAQVVVLCSSDVHYAEVASAATRALVTAGARAVILAGRPGALEAELRGAGLTGAIYVGCDAPTALGLILDRCASEERS